MKGIGTSDTLWGRRYCHDGNTPRRNSRHGGANPRIDKREPCPRRALAAVVEREARSYAALSRMLRRPPDYLSRFVRDGVPAALRPGEHRLLADYFGLDERGLGVRDLWSDR